MPTTPEVGKTYTVDHERKGRFKAKVMAIHGEFVDLLMVEGRTRTMLPENSRSKGERVDVRVSLCKFTPVN